MIIAKENLLQVCFTDERKPESVIANEISMEEREPKSINKSANTNKEQYTIYETEY